MVGDVMLIIGLAWGLTHFSVPNNTYERFFFGIGTYKERHTQHTHTNSPSLHDHTLHTSDYHSHEHTTHGDYSHHRRHHSILSTSRFSHYLFLALLFFGLLVGLTLFLGVLLTTIRLTSYLIIIPSLYTLVFTLRISFGKLIRYIFSILPFYFGFMFCGDILFGPHSENVRALRDIGHRPSSRP